ncbi:C40 family peptidase [Achromobacter sp. AGC39]
MSPDVLTTVREAAVRAYPEEACGFIVQNGSKAFAVEVKNRHEDPLQHFRIAREDRIEAQARGTILGVWHTHPGRTSDPSDADRVGIEATHLPWLIQGLTQTADGKFEFARHGVYTPEGFQMPYEGRPYVAGCFDCWSLVVDYMAREHNVLLNRYPYTQADGTPGFHLFDTDAYVDEGLVLLTDRKKVFLPGDILFMQVLDGNRPDHCAVYIGDDRILHHNHGRNSSIDVFGTRSKYVTHHLRHESLCN